MTQAERYARLLALADQMDYTQLRIEQALETFGEKPAALRSKIFRAALKTIRASFLEAVQEMSKQSRTREG